MKLSEHIQIFKRSLKLLFSLSRTYFICLVLNSVISAALPYVPIYFSARLIDALYASRPVKVLACYVLLTVGLVFMLSLLNTYVSSKRNIASGEMYRSERWLFSEKAMQLAYESIEDNDVTLQRERIRIESQTGYNLFYLYTRTESLIGNITQIVLSLTMTASFFMIEGISIGEKAVLICSVLLAVWIGILTTKKAENLRNHYFESCVEINLLGNKLGDYLEDYNCGKDIRVYNMADGLNSFVYDVFNKANILSAKVELKRSAVSLADTVMNYLVRLGTYLLLISSAFSGEISIGSIAQYVSCIMLLLTAVSSLVSSLQLTLVNHKYLKRYFSYLDIPNHMYQGTLTVEKRDDNEYDVEFRNVSFRYPNTDVYALRHVNLKFRVGERLAVVGMNGSGKTTFIKLLCRLYDPTEGEILLNGVNIKKYDYNEYMSIFSVVFQDFQLFSFSLGQNVAANAEYDEERVVSCLKEAGFGDRLAAMAGGTKTCLYKDYDKEGVEISGGEAQKIALARALYKKAPFIILDEPTAALDPVSEYEVYSRFNEIAGDRTAVYISHRLASCRFCDKIAVFHEGEIIQQGTHETLIADTDGKYCELWNAQAQYYTERKA